MVMINDEQKLLDVYKSLWYKYNIGFLATALIVSYIYRDLYITIFSKHETLFVDMKLERSLQCSSLSDNDEGIFK